MTVESPGLCDATGQTSFEVLVDAYYGRVYAFLRAWTYSAAVTEDLTQDVFERAWAAWGRYRHDQPRRWLFAIAQNLLRDRARRHAVLAFEHLSDELAELQTGTVFPQPEESIVRSETLAELRTQLRRGLGGLSPDTVSLVVGMYAGDATLASLAASRGITIPAVKSRLHRARALLRERIDRPDGMGELGAGDWCAG